MSGQSSTQFGRCEDVEWHDDYPFLGGTSARYAIWGDGMAFVVWADRRANRDGGSGGSVGASGHWWTVSMSAGVGFGPTFDDKYMTLQYELEGTLDEREGTLSINGVTYDLARGSLFLVTVKEPEPVVLQLDRDTMKMKPGKESLAKLAREDPEVAAFLARSKAEE